MIKHLLDQLACILVLTKATERVQLPGTTTDSGTKRRGQRGSTQEDEKGGPENTHTAEVKAGPHHLMQKDCFKRLAVGCQQALWWDVYGGLSVTFWPVW